MAPLGSRVTGERRRRVTDVATVHAGHFRMARKNTAAVLVVDDDPDARNIYSSYLRLKGFVVFTAADGRGAIDKAMTLGPDLIVMDLAMPRVDGFEAIRKIRASSWTRRIPIVAISAVALSQDMALSAGCDAYLAKPVDPEALWLQIMSMLRLSNMPSPA